MRSFAENLADKKTIGDHGYKDATLQIFLPVGL
jgi:hypothetical protein